jgi:predicted glycoside hydrolase/deacetylase ChbG (UPF0249 family)
VIINADDLGVTPAVNRAAFDLMDRGRITSATLLANGAAVEEAAEGARRRARCFSLGTIRTLAVPGEVREALFLEWSAQVERVRALGIRISHLDSHHHVHTHPWLFFVLKRIQQRFQVRKVRTTRTVFPCSSSGPRLWRKWALKGLWNFALRHYVATRTTDGFTDIPEFCRWARRGRGRFRSWELLTHPGGLAVPEEALVINTDWARDLPCPIQLISYDEL